MEIIESLVAELVRRGISVCVDAKSTKIPYKWIPDELKVFLDKILAGEHLPEEFEVVNVSAWSYKHCCTFSWEGMKVILICYDCDNSLCAQLWYRDNFYGHCWFD